MPPGFALAAAISAATRGVLLLVLDDQHHGLVDQAGDGREVRLGVVGQGLEHALVRGQERGRRHRERVAIRRRLGHHRHADLARGAAAVVHDEGHAQRRVQLLAQRPRDHVHTAASGQGHDQLDGLVRVLALRGRQAGEGQGGEGGGTGQGGAAVGHEGLLKSGVGRAPCQCACVQCLQPHARHAPSRRPRAAPRPGRRLRPCPRPRTGACARPASRPSGRHGRRRARPWRCAGPRRPVPGGGAWV